MKLSILALGALALFGTASANVPCNTNCMKMKCFQAWCQQKGYVVYKTMTVTKEVGGASGAAQPTMTKTCTRTVTSSAGGDKDAGGKGGEVKTVTITAAVEDDEPETVTKISTKTCTKTVTKTVTAEREDDGY
ncbi:hypothetical protein TWF730_000584 [Orbilia blumenaviensis]|uniref:Uncharacterized protein n=1 Tax=Orbilia blumenaviensis TaxID=1796055 RepID=A0AAV9VP33_9PEZI